MNIEILDHYPAELDALAAEAPAASFYQTSSWISPLNRSFPTMSARCLVARSAGSPVGYLPFFSVKRGPIVQLHSLPFGTYGGPVSVAGAAVSQRLLQRYLRLRRSPVTVELSWTDFQNLGTPAPAAAEPHSTQIIDLERGFEAIWSDSFEKAKRRQTRKAEREGLSIVEATAHGHIAAYHAIYRERISDWGESFCYPEHFLRRLIEEGGERVKLFLVLQDDEVLGGHINFYFRDMVTAWNGVTRRDTRGQQASTYLYTSLIRHACEHGYKRYNLGSSLGKSSLEQYKASLGGDPYHYRHYRVASPVGRVLRWCRRILTRS